MRKTIPVMCLLVALTASTRAQTNVWHDDFDQFPVGANSDTNTYGAIAYNFTGPGIGHPLVMITNNLPDNLPGDPSYTHSNNCAFTVDTNPSDYSQILNFAWRINQVPVIGGNTNTSLRAYTLNFDMAVQGADISGIGGFVAPDLGLYGPNSGEYFGFGCETNVPPTFFPPVGTGYQHYSLPLNSFGSAHATLLDPTAASFAFFIGFYMAGHNYPGTVEIDLANVSITMSNPPPPPPPTMQVLRAKPALRIFAQDNTHTYNQEGFSTVDVNQSWVGVATPANPVSYAITLADFDTVNNYTLYAQFAQNANSGDPFGVYFATNAVVWQITHQDSGFTTRVDWKTNSPASGQPNNSLLLTTTSTNGRGTWTLTFTNDTDGTVTAPDGSSGSFSLDPNITPSFANPMVLDIGTAPNATAGYGQWIDISRIAITNVINGNEFDDFTQDDTLNTGLWNPRFSYNNNPQPYCVVQVSSNTPYWINWTSPAEGFGLGTKGSLGNTNQWFTPAYYGSAFGVANTPPTLMGFNLNWTLIPAACLPTVDETPGSTPSPEGFFRLLKPPPTQ